MTQAIFKSWFVDFEPFGGEQPPDWQEVEFSDFLTPRSTKVISDDDTPMLSLTNAGIVLRESKFNKTLAASTTKVKLTEYSDLVFGNSRHTLNWGVVRIPRGGVSSVYNVFMVSDNVNSCYLESFIKAKIGYFGNIIRATTRDNQSIDVATLMNKSIYLPPGKVLAEYYAIEDALTKQMRERDAESASLVELRDALLPRMMSGELSVADIDQLNDDLPEWIDLPNDKRYAIQNGVISRTARMKRFDADVVYRSQLRECSDRVPSGFELSSHLWAISFPRLCERAICR